MDFDQPPVVRVWADPERPLAPRVWPMDVPAVAQLVSEGLELSSFVTFLVGENGSGKSTIVEAVATAFGLSPEGGSTQGHHSTRTTESPLGRSLRLQRGLGASRWGFFLRAETMHGWYTFEEQQVDPRRPRTAPLFHEMSHGESFLEVLRTRFDSPGFYCLDEPEAALSFSAQLGLIGTLDASSRRAARSCAPPTLRCSPPCRAPRSSRWATGATGLRRGTGSSSSSTGRPTSTRPAATCATCSTEKSSVPATPRRLEES